MQLEDETVCEEVNLHSSCSNASIVTIPNSLYVSLTLHDYFQYIYISIKSLVESQQTVPISLFPKQVEWERVPEMEMWRELLNTSRPHWKDKCANLHERTTISLLKVERGTDMHLFCRSILPLNGSGLSNIRIMFSGKGRNPIFRHQLLYNYSSNKGESRCNRLKKFHDDLIIAAPCTPLEANGWVKTTEKQIYQLSSSTIQLL